MNNDLERRIRQTGLWLYQLIEDETPSIFRKDYWIGKVMEWCMHNEAFKVEMFRFIDVFPYLTRPESVAKHLQEYFCRPDQCFPAPLQWGLRQLSPTSFAAKMVAKSMAKNITSMGALFIAGATPQEALSTLESLRSQGLAFTVDLLGEAVVSHAEEEEYLNRYEELLDFLGEVSKTWTPLGGGTGDLDWGFAPKVNISLKPSALYSQMNPVAFDYSVERAKERLRPIFRKAVATGAFVCLDMEHTALKNITLALYQSLMEEPEFRDYPHTGIVIQSYLRESEEDLRQVIEWAKKRGRSCTVRLVKGAYWDAEVVWARQNHWPIPVFTNKYETDANFEKLARILLENHAVVACACASHNIRSLAYVLELSKDLKVPPDRLEYQILYGMAEPVRTALKRAEVPLRLYTPIGEIIPGMAYLVRRLLENTSNESFLRLSFSEGLSREALLRNPLELMKERPVSEPTEPSAPESGERGPFRNEPPWDWTQSDVRRSFHKALRTVRKSFPVKVPMVIAGSKISAKETFPSVNPNDTREIVGMVAAAGREEADRAVRAAKDAFAAWRDTPPGERAQFLFKAAASARLQRYELAALQVLEVGKSWKEADADVCEAIDFLEYYGREMIRIGSPRRMGRVPGEISHLFYEPRGVAVVIAPWNFPLAISMGMTSAALVTGNTVVYKPASQSPVVGSCIVRLFEHAGLPSGVLNFVPGPGSVVGEFLVTHPDVAVVAFTGSKDVGLRIIEQAAKTPPDAHCIKTVIAELGGKNAIIIDADADLDEAVVQVLYSAFGYQGQKCSACSRLIVLEENYDKFILRLKAAAESLEMGPVEDPKNMVGAVIDVEARKKILDYIEIGKKEGTVLVERPFGDGNGYFVPLTIFTDIRPHHRLAQEEIFGPVLSVIRVRTFEEALDVANGTPYALTGAVFSRSPENIEKARKSFRVGNLYINRGCTGAIVERHPFGGFKMSGVGSKAGGPDYLLHFMVPRTVAENTVRRGFAPKD